jgi:hypothetical protein
LILDPDPAYYAEYQSGYKVLRRKTGKKFTAEKNLYFFDKKLQFIYP